MSTVKIQNVNFHNNSMGEFIDIFDNRIQEQEKTFGLSYESDGEMGEKNKSNIKDNKEQDDMFFNITQDSE